MLDHKTWERQQFEKEEIKRYGVITERRKSREFRPDVEVISVEIEVPTEIDSFTKFDILLLSPVFFLL
jgi:hypothetical protein